MRGTYSIVLVIDLLSLYHIQSLIGSQLGHLNEISLSFSFHRLVNIPQDRTIYWALINSVTITLSGLQLIP